MGSVVTGEFVGQQQSGVGGARASGFQAELMATTVAKNDMIICTALVMGRRAPTIVTNAMVASMKPGSVLVDLAVERGGNVAGAKPDQIADIAGVKIIGYTNLPAHIAADASNLYARNLLAFVGLLVDAEGALAPDLEDEILKGAMLTHAGAITHPAFTAA